MKVLINVITFFGFFGLLGALIREPENPNVGVAITLLILVIFIEWLVEYWTED